MHACMHVCMYASIMHVCMCARTHKAKHENQLLTYAARLRTNPRKHTHAHTLTHTRRHTYTHENTHTHTLTHIPLLLFPHTQIQSRHHDKVKIGPSLSLSLSIYIYIYIYTYIYTYIFINTSKHTHINTHTHTYTNTPLTPEPPAHTSTTLSIIKLAGPVKYCGTNHSNSSRAGPRCIIPAGKSKAVNRGPVSIRARGTAGVVLFGYQYLYVCFVL
jgi:hypothetical protein